MQPENVRGKFSWAGLWARLSGVFVRPAPIAPIAAKPHFKYEVVVGAVGTVVLQTDDWIEAYVCYKVEAAFSQARPWRPVGQPVFLMDEGRLSHQQEGGI